MAAVCSSISMFMSALMSINMKFFILKMFCIVIADNKLPFDSIRSNMDLDHLRTFTLWVLRNLQLVLICRLSLTLVTQHTTWFHLGTHYTFYYHHLSNANFSFLVKYECWWGLINIDCSYEKSLFSFWIGKPNVIAPRLNIENYKNIKVFQNYWGLFYFIFWNNPFTVTKRLLTSTDIPFINICLHHWRYVKHFQLKSYFVSYGDC